MNYVFVAPNTTWCPDTPENWRNFNRLKTALAQPHGNTLKGQATKEDRRLRHLRTFLPGHEPDRF